MVYLLPITMPAQVAEHFLTRIGAVVLVIDPKQGEPADPAVVRDILGLTLGEARVAALGPVGSGVPPRDAAERLGITEETARTALKRGLLQDRRDAAERAGGAADQTRYSLVRPGCVPSPPVSRAS